MRHHRDMTRLLHIATRYKNCDRSFVQDQDLFADTVGKRDGARGSWQQASHRVGVLEHFDNMVKVRR
jgi:hypothetical protein